MESSYYVNIKHSPELRKEILNTIKQSLELVKSNSKLKEIRERKEGKIKEIAELCSSIKAEINRFSLAIPKKSLRVSLPVSSQAPEKKRHKKPLEEKSPAAEKAGKEANELKRLEKSIAEIESQLKSLI